jgi:hypothetical protein
MKKIKEWFDGLPISNLVVAFLLGIYLIKLVTGRNIISGLSDLMRPGKEDWINGVAEGIEAMEGL